jgi:uncharacterized membrane protein YphA (DoxX/SURF4 family)
MRRALNAVAASVVNFARAVAGGWNSFWYTPVDPTLLGIMRILAGSMLVYTHGVWGLALDDFFGPNGWISRDLVDLVEKDQLAYSFWWLVPPRWLWPAYALAMAALVCFTIGLWTRVTAVLALAVVISFVYRVPEALFGLDKISLVLTFYLALGPSGAALSVDRWLARRKRGPEGAAARASVAANFTLRLIQIHMCIIYFFAGVSKLQGQAWWTGNAMWLAFGNLEYQSVDMTWLAWHPWAVEFLTHFTALWELSFCVLIWIPLLRPLVLVTSLVMHLGIGACMGLWTFSLMMLFGCASFLPPEKVGRLVAVLVPAPVAGAAGGRASTDPPKPRRTFEL